MASMRGFCNRTAGLKSAPGPKRALPSSGVAQVEVSCPAEGEQRSGHSGLCFPQFAFSNDACIRFFQILDAIFELALILWEPLGHLVGSAWHIPTDCGLEGHNVASLEFV